ncbi:hypothetical protein ACFSPU_09595 [Haoranjiania flava]|uniref:Long-chain fatty acid transport protein n=1 Tax=Haoranjiania flava TaxID=1856322 RepID=A0AAE3IKH7_9BACT|nr:hypothetical protein [Haoranjiania flava]MCU7693349.1 hypothetical protein [Haoranjiania flava]
MLSVKSIQNKKYFLFACLAILLAVNTQAQENSPFSRYGLGDLFPSQSAQYRAIGGMTSAQGNSLHLVNPNIGTLSLNPANPASYGILRTQPNRQGGNVNYDLGIIGDMRTLKSVNPSKAYNSANLMPAYFTLAFPIAQSGMGIALGIKPVTRVSYSLSTRTQWRQGPQPVKLDTLNSRNLGEGGINQVFLGVGKAFGDFRIGVNGAYNFGKKDISTLTSLSNDTFQYATSSKNIKTIYRGFTWDAGMQYTIKLKEVTDPVSKIRSTYNLDLGVNGSISQKLNARREIAYYKIGFNADDQYGDNPRIIDTISFKENSKGQVTLPTSLNGGFMFNKYLMGVQKYGFGAEYNTTNWSQYRDVENIADTALSNSWMIRAGGYFIPDPLRGASLFSTARYSIGGYYGKDYINVGNTSKDGYDIMAVTFGFGFNLRKQMYSNQKSVVNTAFEIGRRGSNRNNVSENFYKISVGFSLSDIWFLKSRYD